MNCTKCGGSKVDIMETRSAGDYVVRRRRRCLNCSNRFTTYEVVAQEYKDYEKVKRNLRELSRYTERH